MGGWSIISGTVAAQHGGGGKGDGSVWDGTSADGTRIAFERTGDGHPVIPVPGAVDREVEDLVAPIESVGGDANVFGHSSGGSPALHAAARGLPIDRPALHEPPHVADGYRPTRGGPLRPGAGAAGRRAPRRRRCPLHDRSDRPPAGDGRRPPGDGVVGRADPTPRRSSRRWWSSWANPQSHPERLVAPLVEFFG